MDLRERLEVIAADYYTKAMAIKTTIQILQELKPVKEIKKAKKIKVINNKKVHWTQTKKGKAILRKNALKNKPWMKVHANKNNK